MLALLIFAAIVWTLRRLGEHAALAVPSRLKIASAVLVALTFVQLYLGALVAGLRAGLVYNTWPAIDGAFIPSSERLWFEAPWWRNLFENTLTVQFEHRMTAYALLALAIFHAFDALRVRPSRAVVKGAFWLAAAVALQALLGILTLLNQVPILLALSHQARAARHRRAGHASRLAITVDAAGIGQAEEPARARRFIRATVIVALIVIVEGTSVIAGQR
jgi:cytochrome c oxidase assembly protein subunit 15